MSMLTRSMWRAARAWVGPIRNGPPHLRSIPLRSFSQSYPSQEAKPKRPWGRWVLFGSVVVAIGFWKWLTHNNYPKVVADKLREGLMSEINGAGFRKPDYKKALQAYIEALHEADKIEMSPMSDEYTGIQLKVADMYERLGMDREAVLMYGEIANTYLVTLVSNKVPEEGRSDLIKRDLRVATMEGLYLSADPKTAEKTLLPHLQIATREAVRQDPRIARVLAAPLKSLVFDLSGIVSGALPASTLEPAWETFRDELFSLREMKVGLHVASAEYPQALLTKYKSTDLMLQSGFPVGECLLSVANLAAIMYLQWALIVPQSSTKVNDTKLPENGGSDQALTELPTKSNGSAVPPVEKDVRQLSPREVLQDRDALLQLAELTYTEIVDTIRQLKGSDRRSPFVPEAYAISLYGLGVIRASQSDWTAALEYMNEARLRSRGCEVDTLLQSADAEIEKIDKLSQNQSAESSPAELPDVTVVYWRQGPENWVKGQNFPPSLRV